MSNDARHSDARRGDARRSDARRNFRLVRSLGDARIGLEARAQVNDHLDVKVWLRLLACSTQIEQQVRHHLRTRFGTTLPRFDYLAQLERHPDGLRMKLLSHYLMVSGGNVTGITDQLVGEGLVERVNEPDDRRSWRVRLTPAGRTAFAAMAAEHEQWLTDLLADVPPSSKEALYEHLGRLRVQLARRQADTTAETTADTPAETTAEPLAEPPARSVTTRRSAS